MKTIRHYIGVLLVALLANVSLANAQDVQLPLIGSNKGNQYVKLAVNGAETNFLFSNQTNYLILIKPVFEGLKRKGVLADSDLGTTTSVQLPNGQYQSGQVVHIKQLGIGNKMISGIDAIVINSSSTPPVIGQSVLEKLGEVIVDDANNQLIIKSQNTPVKQGGNANKGNGNNKGNSGGGNGGLIPINSKGNKPVNSGGTTALNATISTIKLIPCSSADVTYLQELKQMLESNPDFQNINIEVETRIPPQKATNKLKKGAITIRYFDRPNRNTIQKAEFQAPILNLISSHSYDYPDRIQEENMLPIYNNKPITGYIELWIRKR